MNGDRRSDPGPAPVAVPVPVPARPGPALTQLHEMRVREGPGGVGTAQQQDAAGQEEAAESHAALGPLPGRAQPVPAGRGRRSERAGPPRPTHRYPPITPAPLTAVPAGAPAPLTTVPGAAAGPAAAAAAPAGPWRRARAGRKCRRKCPALPPAPGRAPPPGSGGGAASARARAKMAPLDLDKYVEIARLCKYLPENDLKVRPRRQGRDRPGRAGAERAGAGAAGRAGAGGAGGPGAGPDPAAFPSAAPL